MDELNTVFPLDTVNMEYISTVLQTKADTEVSSKCLVVLPVTFFIVLTAYCILWIIVVINKNYKILLLL